MKVSTVLEPKCFSFACKLICFVFSFRHCVDKNNCLYQLAAQFFAKNVSD